jgi:hypothetical protein
VFRARIEPRDSLAAQLRDLSQRKSECTDQDCAEVLNILWKCDLLLDRWLAIAARAEQVS